MAFFIEWEDYMEYANILEMAKKDEIPPLQLIQIAEQFSASKQPQAAITLYLSWLSNTKSELAYVACFNLGVCYAQSGRHTEAEQSYRAAIQRKPDFPEAWFNLGTVLERLGRAEHALIIWQSMLDQPLVTAERTKDLYILVLNNMGRLLEELRRYDESENKLTQSLLTDPDQPKVIQHWVHLRQKQCKWPVYNPPAGLTHGQLIKYTSPLAMLSSSNDPGLQLATATHFAKEKLNLRVPDLSATCNYQHQKTRIAFLSSDFCLHAVSLLTVEIYELLDREKFDVYGFCWSREDGTEMRQRVINAFDHFFKIGNLDDENAAKLIREHEIDVLIDLQGLTSGARPNILAYRPAPTQITYLGFPGGSGLSCIDYILCDKYLIPDEEAAFYIEKPLYLPDIFQCSDRKRPIGKLPSREDCGLPADSIIYCSFNNNYKFTPEIFECWMNILHAVDNSILWLLADNEWSKENIIVEAQKRGIDSRRIYFAPRIAPADYLARYTVADLFLDATPFNAGTTANDALWMGLPVLTLSGRTFASRMAGSLLHSLNLDELITTTLADYQTKAIELGTNPKSLRKIKEKLKNKKKTTPTFDLPKFVKNFEKSIISVLKK